MSQIKRYTYSPRLKGAKQYGTSEAHSIIWNAVENNLVDYTIHIAQENERLDILAGEFYGEGRNWWIIAAASGIGWGLQVPPGTKLKIPTDLTQLKKVGL